MAEIGAVLCRGDVDVAAGGHGEVFAADQIGAHHRGVAGLRGCAGRQARNSGQQAEIAPGGHSGGFAGAVVLGIGGLGAGGEQAALAGLGLDKGAERILHGHHGQIAARRELGVAARAHLGTGHGHVPPGGHVQVAARRHSGAGVGDAVLPTA